MINGRRDMENVLFAIISSGILKKGCAIMKNFRLLGNSTGFACSLIGFLAYFGPTIFFLFPPSPWDYARSVVKLDFGLYTDKAPGK